MSRIGCRDDCHQVEELIRRFDRDGSGRVDWANGEFLGVIAAIAVTGVADIDDFVFSAAFRTFDHVSRPGAALLLVEHCVQCSARVAVMVVWQDADGLITPLEMHIVTRLFLPMEIVAQDAFVEELIAKMDTNVDGKIDFQEFVHFVRSSGSADIFSTQTSLSSDSSG
jgi:Ca2+-binding EF-hand superfamily protein